MKYEGQTFEDMRVELDGNEYRGCTFTRCTFVYRGGGVPVLSGCTVNEMNFAFDDAAGRTMLFLGQLYHTGFQSFVEGVFGGVRRTTSVPDEQR